MAYILYLTTMPVCVLHKSVKNQFVLENGIHVIVLFLGTGLSWKYKHRVGDALD